MASRAIVIGPANYARDSGIASHPEIAHSARMYGQVLGSDPRWGSEAVEVLPPERLTSINDVMGAVQSAADQAQPGDTLLVVYIGHGAYWADVPGDQVHFAVGSSRLRQPHTWMSSWYVYRAMRRSRASLKVLIADCCYSNMLPQLSGEGTLRGVLGIVHEGTCVLTATKNDRSAADAAGCPRLPSELQECTPFSGHLLNVLTRGTKHYNDEVTLGLMLDVVQVDMQRCSTPHDLPNMILNGGREGMPLFTNRMSPPNRERMPSAPASAEEWVETMKREGAHEFDRLLNDPVITGQVVSLLYQQSEEAVRHIALRVNKRANQHFDRPELFAQYWAEVGPTLSA
jgi:hypothetical protein